MWVCGIIRIVGGDSLKFDFIVKEQAYAKINLYLDVVSKRTDGFHDIKSIMQSVSLCDLIDVEITEKNEDILTCNIGDIPLDGKNIAIKAADAFRKAVGLDFGTRIHIEKNIPFIAGLGGGSSDGAAVIRALNYLTESKLSEEKMIEIAASVGSDVPFCLFGGTSLCEGRGELIKKLPNVKEFDCVIAIKGEGVSTPWAFSEIDKKYGDFSGERDLGKLFDLEKAIFSGIKDDVKNGLFNIFEEFVEEEREEIKSLKDIMKKADATAVMMSGSGPSVFGLFDDEIGARNAVELLKAYGAKAYYCKTI